MLYADGQPMSKDHRKLVELETSLSQMRDDLNALSHKINAEPTNTSLVIRRVNLMGRIVAVQTAVDELRKDFARL